MIGDVARYLFWVHLREVVDPQEPGLVRAIASVAAGLCSRSYARARWAM